MRTIFRSTHPPPELIDSTPTFGFRFWLVATLVSSVLLAPLGASDPLTSEATVIAEVNNEAVTAELAERSLSRLHSAVMEGARAAPDLDQLMFRVVNDVLLAQEARALGMDQESPIPEKIETMKRDLALKKLDAVEILPRSQPTDEEVESLFQKQYRRVTFRVVTAYDLQGAEELAATLRSGADITVLAEEKSVDPYRLRGGLVNNIARIDLQRSIGEVVFSLSPGELSSIIQTDLGWSVVRVDSFEPADPERLESLEPTLKGLIRQRKGNEARALLAEELRRKYPAATDEDAVALLEPERLPDSRLMPTNPAPETILVRIGDVQVVSAQEYADALTARWKGVRNIEAARAAAPIVLDGLIENKLMVAEALARGYEKLPKIERVVHAYETELLLQRYLQEILVESVSVTEQDKKSYYEQHREEFHRPPRVRLGQVTVATEEEGARVAKDLRNGADLAWIAEQRSLDGFKEKGGMRGWHVPKPGGDGFDQRLFEAPTGSVLEPFSVLDQWIVLQVLERQDQGIYDFDEVSGNIRDSVFDMSFRQALDDLIKKLRSRSEIQIYEDVVASLSVTGSQEKDPAAEAGHGH